MSVDQTFHTPSFGDEEFEIPPLNLAPTAAASRCSGQGVFGNQVPVEYIKRRLNGGPIYVYLPRRNNFNGCQTYVNHHPSCQQQQQQQQHLLPQNHMMESAQYRSPPPQQQSRGLSPPQQMYQNSGGEMLAPHSMHMQMQSYDNRTTYSNAPMHQGTMQPPQMPIMQQQQQQQQQHMGQMGPPQQQPMFSTISQSQMSSQLGLQIGMGPSPHHQGSGSMGSTPPGSNHNSPGLETSEDSDDSTPLAQLIGGMKRPSPEPVDVTTTTKVTKKPKAQKKKKKRDPNEPQKPVSAYALFFRDTQAAIKGQNPNASFGEVSKIVASMWDSLDVDHKNVYKKKTENAKKEYLKALAAYRATLVSKQSPQSMMNDNSQSHMMHQNTMVNIHPPQMQQQQQRPPQQQMGNMNRPQAPQISAVPPQLCHSASNSPTYPQNISPASAGGAHPNIGSGEMMVPLQTCLRNGCSNPAVDSPDWDREYCSSECVVSHCRDVFTAWVASRQANTVYPTVK